MNALNVTVKSAQTALGNDDVKGAVEDLAMLLQEVQFSKREFKAAGISAEVIRKWVLGLTLLTEA